MANTKFSWLTVALDLLPYCWSSGCDNNKYPDDANPMVRRKFINVLQEKCIQFDQLWMYKAR